MHNAIKKKEDEREGWREGKIKEKIQGTIYISMASPNFI